jgi:integrase
VIYLGEYGSPESKDAYGRIVDQWLRDNQTTYRDCPRLTFNKLAVAYLKHCRSYYVKDGRQTTEVQAIRDALRYATKLYGRLAAVEFSPKKLQAVRQTMIDAALCRNSVNAAVRRIRRMFRWAVAEELVPPSVLHGLQAVPDLRKGRSAATESAPVRPVSEADVNAVLPHVSTVVRDMIRVQLLTGARPAEVCALRPIDIDRTGEVWTAKLTAHKTEHFGHERTLHFGPNAQAVLAEYLDNRPAESPMFQPVEAEAARHEKQRQSRKTRVQPSQRNRRKASPKRKPRDRYDVASYRRAITRGCVKGGITPWSPNRLRHAHATDLRRKYGIEAAKTVLGHRQLSATLLYAEADMEAARAVMAEVG